MTGEESDWDFCSLGETNFWKQQDESIYKFYNLTLNSVWPAFWDDFFNLEGNNGNLDINYSNTLFNLFQDWAGNECVFKELTLEERIASLKLLSLRPLREDNMWNVWIFSEPEEENLYNAILRTTPEDQYEEILATFEGGMESNSNTTLFYDVKIKMLDPSWPENGFDERGYDEFVSILTKMILTVKLDKTVQEDEAQELSLNEYYSGGLPKYLYEYKIDAFGNGPMNLYVEEWEYPVSGAPDLVNTSFPATGHPFDYMRIQFNSSSKFTLPDGRKFKDGNKIEIPFCYAEWLFRRYNQASFDLVTRQVIDVATIIMGMATTPIGGFGMAILVADVTYSAADVVVATDNYNLELTGEAYLGKKGHKIWDIAGTLIGVPDLLQMVYSVPGGIKVIFSKTKSFAMYLRSSMSPTAAKSKIIDLINYLKGAKKGLIEDLPNPDILDNSPDNIPTNLEEHIAAIKHIDGQIKGLQIVNSLSDDVLDITINLASNGQPMTGNLKYINFEIDNVFEIATVAGDLPKIKPIGSPDWPNHNNGWITGSDVSSFSYTSSIDGIHYTNIDDVEKFGKLDVYWDAQEARYLFKVADIYSGLAADFPQFFTLFQNKNWDFAADFTAGLANTNLKNLSDTKKVDLLSEMNQWDNIEEFKDFRDYVVAGNSFDGSGNFIGNTKFDFLQANFPENVPAWKIFNDKASDLVDDITAMERMVEDLGKHADFSTFVKTDNNLDKWKVLNSIKRSDIGNFHLTEWFEGLWFKGGVEITPPTSPDLKVLVKHDGDEIAEVGGDVIDMQSFDDVGAGPFVGDDIAFISDDGAFAVVKNSTTGKTACRGGACFPAGTPIHLPNGDVEPIEEVKQGQMVVAWSETAQDTVHAKVVNVVSKTWYRLCRVITGQDTILATNNHPFYIPKLKRYIAADSLKAGMKLLALTGTLMVINEVEAFDTTVQVYNFEVEEVHNYFVGDIGLLVHNDCRVNSAGITDDDIIEIFGNGSPLSQADLDFLRTDLGSRIGNVNNGTNTPLYDFFREGIDSNTPDNIRSQIIQRRLEALVSVLDTELETNLKFLRLIEDGLQVGVLRKYRLPTDNDFIIISNIKDYYGTPTQYTNIGSAKGTIGTDPINLESLSGGNYSGMFGNLSPQPPLPGRYDTGNPQLDSHTEIKICNYLYDLYKNNPNISGEIEVISRWPICPNCTDYLDQFQLDFPNLSIKRIQLYDEYPF